MFREPWISRGRVWERDLRSRALPLISLSQSRSCPDSGPLWRRGLGFARTAATRFGFWRTRTCESRSWERKRPS